MADFDFKLAKRGSDSKYSQYRDVNPNVQNLVNSLMSPPYPHFNARLAEMIDNACDAKARFIGVFFDGPADSVKRITFVDAGSGMTKERLNQCFRLGSDTVHKASDIGFYGMGGTIAASSIAKSILCVTRSKNGVTLVANYKPGENAAELQAFGEASSELEAEFEKQLQRILPRGSDVSKQSGTVFFLSDWRRELESVSKAALASKLADFIPETYRTALNSGVQFQVNDRLITKAIDPVADPEGKILFDKEVNLGGGVKVHLTVKQLAPESEGGVKHNSDAQGFYVDRGQRQIMKHVTLGLFVKHAESNSFRARLVFQAKDDVALNADFAKTQIVLNDSQAKVLKKIVSPIIAQIREEQKALRNAPEKFDSRYVKSALENLVCRLKDLKEIFGELPVVGLAHVTSSIGDTGRNNRNSSDSTREPRERDESRQPSENKKRATKLMDFAALGSDQATHTVDGQTASGYPFLTFNTDHPTVKNLHKDPAWETFFLQVFCNETAIMKVSAENNGDDVPSKIARIRDLTSQSLAQLFTPSKKK